MRDAVRRVALSARLLALDAERRFRYSYNGSNVPSGRAADAGFKRRNGRGNEKVPDVNTTPTRRNLRNARLVGAKEKRKGRRDESRRPLKKFQDGSNSQNSRHSTPPERSVERRRARRDRTRSPQPRARKSTNESGAKAANRLTARRMFTDKTSQFFLLFPDQVDSVLPATRSIFAEYSDRLSFRDSVVSFPHR